MAGNDGYQSHGTSLVMCMFHILLDFSFPIYYKAHTILEQTNGRLCRILSKGREQSVMLLSQVHCSEVVQPKEDSKGLGSMRTVQITDLVF